MPRILHPPNRLGNELNHELAVVRGGRCSHGPVGRLPGVKSSAELDRPQAGGYNFGEIVPVGSRNSTSATALEIRRRLP